MSKKKVILYTLLLFVLFTAGIKGNNENKKQSTIEKSKKERKIAVDKTNRLLDEAKKFEKNKNHEMALDRYRKVIKLTYQFKFNNNFLIAMLQNQNNAAIKVRKFDEAIKSAKAIEKIDREFFKRQSPFHAFRLAETYCYMDNAEKAFEWLEKCVYKRGFNRIEMLLESPLKTYKNKKKFKAIVKAIYSNLGVGKLAKEFDVQLLNGKKISLKMLKGKVVLLDFWAQWCPPCIKEINRMKVYYPELKKKGLEIVGISLDTDKKKFNDFLKRNLNINWKLSCTFEGWKSEIVKKYNVKGVPSVWLIDRKGILRYFNIRENELEKRIKELLDEV